MLIKVKTLTGKEIEIDIEADDTISMDADGLVEVLGARDEPMGGGAVPLDVVAAAPHLLSLVHTAPPPTWSSPPELPARDWAVTAAGYVKSTQVKLNSRSSHVNSSACGRSQEGGSGTAE